MEKKTKLRIFLVVPVLFGLAAVIFFGMARTNRDHGLPSRQAHVQALWAKEPSEGPAQPADTAKAAPPRLALQNPSELDAEGRRSQEGLRQLTEAAKLTPQQQLRAAGIIKDIEHARSLIDRFPDATERHSLHEKLEKQERKAMDAVITPEQAGAVDAYFAKRTRELQ